MRCETKTELYLTGLDMLYFCTKATARKRAATNERGLLNRNMLITPKRRRNMEWSWKQFAQHKSREAQKNQLA